MTENKMKEIRLEKLTLNMCAGNDAPKIEKSKSIIKTIAGKDAVITKTHRRTNFGMPKAKAIGAKLTLRGDEALELLKKLIQAKDNRIKPSQFDTSGNFSFGIHEYINIPGIKYNPDAGMLGLDVCATLERRGYRVKKRKTRQAKVGKKHIITIPEAIKWAKSILGVVVSEDEE